MILGIGRGFLLVGLITYILAVSSITYFRRSVNNSHLGRRFFKVAPVTYGWLWNSVLSKFSPGGEFNNSVRVTEEDLDL